MPINQTASLTSLTTPDYPGNTSHSITMRVADVGNGTSSSSTDTSTRVSNTAPPSSNYTSPQVSVTSTSTTTRMTTTTSSPSSVSTVLTVVSSTTACPNSDNDTTGAIPSASAASANSPALKFLSPSAISATVPPGPILSPISKAQAKDLQSDHSSTGAIVGGTVGSVGLLLLGAILIWLYRRRRAAHYNYAPSSEFLQPEAREKFQYRLAEPNAHADSLDFEQSASTLTPDAVSPPRSEPEHRSHSSGLGSDDSHTPIEDTESDEPLWDGEMLPIAL